MALLLQIEALDVFSIDYSIFIGITEGLRLTVGYRGSNETRERKQRIDTAIHNEAEKSIEEFLQKTDSPKNKIDEVSNLGYRCFVAQNFTEELLDGIGSFYKNTLLFFLVATLFLSMVVVGFTTFDLSPFRKCDNSLSLRRCNCGSLLVFCAVSSKRCKVAEYFG